MRFNKPEMELELPALEGYNKIEKSKTRDRFLKYKVNLQETSEGYAVWVPGLSGC
jgi:hypothetical protein